MKQRVSWLGHWHRLLAVFVFFFGLGMAVASLSFQTDTYHLVKATSLQNLRGWLWADPIGWISMNDIGSAGSGGGSYGVNVDPTTGEMTGFAWSDNAGWLCFGSSCSATPACAGTNPQGQASNAAHLALTPIEPEELQGWAKVCNQGDAGWISLNCTNLVGGCNPYAYRVGFRPSTGYFNPTDSLAWNGSSDGSGFGYIDFRYVSTTSEKIAYADNQDNDQDGSKDCLDPDTAGNPICITEDPSSSNCTDGVDNNGDGLIDCADANCKNQVPECTGPEGSNDPTYCVDGIDNDGDGILDCGDSDCQGLVSVCTGPEGSVDPTYCTDGIDNDNDGIKDCADPNCSGIGACFQPEGDPNASGSSSSGSGGSGSGSSGGSGGSGSGSSSGGSGSSGSGGSGGSGSGGSGSGSGGSGSSGGSGGSGSSSGGPANMCSDGIDNDGDGVVDCNEAACSTDPACSSQPQEDCSNGIDDDGDNLIDCEDPICYSKPGCSAWLQAVSGNVYAEQGIVSDANSSKATARFCLSSAGTITGVTSSISCTEQNSSSLSLPSTASGYKGSLGNLDLDGLLAGRYGRVIPIVSGSQIPNDLNGRVYYSQTSLSLEAHQFRNAIGTARGNGLLIVDGDLTIKGDLGYDTRVRPEQLRQLASFGVIVRKTTAAGGNISIDSSVRTLVGAYFAEDQIRTGTTGGTDQPLRILGVMAARRFALERQYRNADIAAEQFIFDGRAVANPPPASKISLARYRA